MLGRGNDGARQIKGNKKIEKHCVITSFVICTLQKTSLGRLNEVGWDELDTNTHTHTHIHTHERERFI
jgi:hypothetical protein